MSEAKRQPHVAIACGGTGGHLFPGVTVGEELLRAGCRVTLLVSPKEIDQAAVQGLRGFQIITLPAVGLQNRNYNGFARGCWNSFRAAREYFRKEPPQAVLAMGGFTAAPPVLAGWLRGAATFIHESNAIPGRANRLLARMVSRVFVGFVETADRIRNRRVEVTGTPVRKCFQSVVGATCRRVLELAPERETLLVLGGSQGAKGVNDLVMQALPMLLTIHPGLQVLWIAGRADVQRVREFCERNSFSAVVRTFIPEMEVAYGAATIAVSRSGAGTLAELAAMRLPAILIPLPTAADNHQYFNALALEKTGAARLLRQPTATPEKLRDWVSGLLRDTSARRAMASALKQWHQPDAAARVAASILATVKQRNRNLQLQPVAEADSVAAWHKPLNVSSA